LVTPEGICFIESSLTEIPNKYIIRVEPILNLVFEIYLEIGAWDLLFKTPNSKAEPKNSDLAQRTKFFMAK